MSLIPLPKVAVHSGVNHTVIFSISLQRGLQEYILRRYIAKALPTPNTCVQSSMKARFAFLAVKVLDMGNIYKSSCLDATEDPNSEVAL